MFTTEFLPLTWNWYVAIARSTSQLRQNGLVIQRGNYIWRATACQTGGARLSDFEVTLSRELSGRVFGTTALQSDCREFGRELPRSTRQAFFKGSTPSTSASPTRATPIDSSQFLRTNELLPN